MVTGMLKGPVDLLDFSLEISFKNFSDWSHYPCYSNVYLLLPSAEIYHQQHNTATEICTLLKVGPWREIKLSGLNEHLCFETVNSGT